MGTHVNIQLQLAFDFIQYTNQNIFLTGKAGTGKTTFLKKLKKVSPKRMVVVAPTGVAAINAGGVTIHSFFQLSFGPQIPVDAVKNLFNDSPPSENTVNKIKRFSKNKINLIKSLDLLIIDEISMVRADILDAIDFVLRRFKTRSQPFGGVQLLMIGDLQQLAPVTKKDDWDILKNYYATFYFFSSHALGKSKFISIELKHIYRQNEQNFINLLNKVRDNKLNEADLQLLNRRYRPGFSPLENEGYITLTTHNFQAKQINEVRLEKIKTKLHRFKCSVEGDFPEYYFPADEVLELKTGAQVMFLKNDTSPEKRYYNGKIGKVINITEENIEVTCTGETEPVIVEKAVWENIKYKLNQQTSEIEENIIGTFKQYPLKLAWAITIHKSQGLTFEKAIIDARRSFAHGQVYVALSRCTCMEGLVLSSKLNSRSIINDSTVIHFINEVEKNQPDGTVLNKYHKAYELELLNELFDFTPLIKTGESILKIWSVNRSSLTGNIEKICRKMVNDINEMIIIAEKFRPQMEEMVARGGFAEKNIPLQRRLVKAANYFSDQTEEMIEKPFKNAGFESDNQSIMKNLNDKLTRFEKELCIKKACFKKVEKGFNIKEYLETRARAAIEKQYLIKGSSAVALNVKNPEFYKILKDWRKEKQIETGLSESQILRHKVIAGIAGKLPATASELKAVKGMGGSKMAYFGREILGLIMDYRYKKGMDIPVNAREEVTLAGLNTKEVSLRMFREGLTIEEISKKRNLAVTTIEDHLTHFVRQGKLDIFQLIDHSKYDIIAKCLKEKADGESLTDVRNKLGNEFTYGEIRMVLADMN
jgi:hypothetical protein